MKRGETIMYQTSCVVVSKTSEHKLYNYCKNQCEGSKLLKNATLFRCRQLLFAYEKDYKNLLDKKDSPIDKGKEIYERLYLDRTKVRW